MGNGFVSQSYKELYKYYVNNSIIKRQITILNNA